MIIATVNGQNISLEYSGVISDSVRFLTVRFVFDSSWDNTAKTAVFKHNDSEYDVVMANGNSMYLGDNICYVPQEVIKAPSFLCSVYGVKNNTLITASSESVAVQRSGYDDLIPADPTPSLWMQVLAVSNTAINTANSVKEDADDGKFNGKGVPVGGVANQVLAKRSGDNFDTEWKALPSYCTTEFVAGNFVNKTTKINGIELQRDIDLTADDIGAYEINPYGIPKRDLSSFVQASLTKADSALQAADIVNKEDKPSVVSSYESFLTLADNTIYNLSDVASLSISFPQASFCCYINLSTASTGDIDISFPNAGYIGPVPIFSNGETWEISVKDGIIVAGKAE